MWIDSMIFLPSRELDFEQLALGEVMFEATSYSLYEMKISAAYEFVKDGQIECLNIREGTCMAVLWICTVMNMVPPDGDDCRDDYW